MNDFFSRFFFHNFLECVPLLLTWVVMKSKNFNSHSTTNAFTKAIIEMVIMSSLYSFESNSRSLRREYERLYTPLFVQIHHHLYFVQYAAIYSYLLQKHMFALCVKCILHENTFSTNLSLPLNIQIFLA